MRAKLLPLMVAAILTGASGTTAIADDGAINNKSMSRNAHLTVEPFEGTTIAEAEHAFTDTMKFYVPSQAASGELLPIEYYNADDALVETLEVAKPQISVFIYGPTVEVGDLVFAHSYMDAFAAVSLDDGVTWKTTNLSESADQSSFTLDVSNASDGNLGGEATVLASDVHIHRSGGKTGGEAVNGGSANSSGVSLRSGGKTGGEAANSSGANGSGLGMRSGGKTGGAAANASGANGSGVGMRAKGLEDGDGYGLGDGTGEALEPEDGSGYGPGDGTGINASTKGGRLTSLGAQVPGRGDGNGGLNLGAGNGAGSGVGANLLANAGLGTGNGPNSASANGDGTATGGGAFAGPAAVDEVDAAQVTVDLTEYPGGVFNVFHSTVGNKTLVAWPSRYCQQGKPAYAMDDAEKDAVVQYIQQFESGFNLDDDLYLTDLFGVAGSQGSHDLADEGYPEVGEVPYGCVWTARGVMLPGDDPRTSAAEESHMVWTKAERLTSGRRDPNRIEVMGVQNAGFAITWQEDPDGLRPGQGEGPGEGWSGAVAHDKTDVWYSFINWQYFDIVDDGNGEPINVIDFDLSTVGRPQVFVPMAVPMRITNNDKCVYPINPLDESYCNYDVAAPYGLQNFCADFVDVPLGPQGTLTPICVNEDGLPNIANTAATRPRLSLQGYDSDGDGITESAWVVLTSEESKGLGRFFFLPDGTPCEEGTSEDCEEEIGKNIWYFSFDMGTPDTSATADLEYGLVQNLVQQGNLMNQPEVDWRTGELYPVRNTADMWDFGIYNFDMYNTEIARRGSLLVQGLGKIINSENHLAALPSWKQGIMRQGGPADTMLRRIYMPCEETVNGNGSGAANGPGNTAANATGTAQGNGKGLSKRANGNGGGSGNGKVNTSAACSFTQSIDNNPYAFTNVLCENWVYDDGSNPYYPAGVCLDPATNLSGVVPDTCTDSETGSEVACPTVDFTSSTFGIADTNPILQGLVQGEGNTTKVLTWHQCPSDGTQTSGDFSAVDCDSDDRTDDYVNLADQSWYNPLDIAKGHRGFLDGDFVMFLYAWSPNWRLNAVGHDRYELYIRRSFDGANSWTTLPSSFLATNGESYSGDGTVTCETYRSSDTGGGDLLEPHVCYDYPAGGAEQARDVTQHQAMRITTLDPRYAISGSPLGTPITDTCLDGILPDETDSLWSCDDTSEMDTDERNPSRYMIVFEAGDNTTTSEGEAEPVDLYYGRAINFGDDYTVWAEETDLSVCYPSDDHGDDVSDVLVGSGFCNEFDRMNTRGDTHSSEANLEANPDASKLYAVWAQWVFEDDSDYDSEIVESDAMARRVWWIEDYIPSDAWEALLGGGQE